MLKALYYCRRLEFNQSNRSLVARNHYSGTCPNGVKHIFGLIRKSDDEIVGIAAFGSFSSRGAYFRFPMGIEFQRLWVCDSVPKNGESFLIGFSLRYLKKLKGRGFNRVIAYSDPSVGHTGTVYLASNFKQLETKRPTRAHFKYRDKQGNTFVHATVYRQAILEGRSLGELISSGVYEKVASAAKIPFEYLLGEPQAVVKNQKLEVVSFSNPGVSDWDEAIHAQVKFGKELMYIDQSDLAELLKLTIFKTPSGYFSYRDKNSSRALHRLIANTPDGLVCDHINGMRIDNRRCNLRNVSYLLNVHNRERGRQRGARFCKKRKTWQARLTFNRSQSYLGSYQTKDEALRAYDLRAIEIFGPYALTNFPLSDYDIPEKYEAEELITQKVFVEKNMDLLNVCEKCGRRAKKGQKFCHYHIEKDLGKNRPRVSVAKKICEKPECEFPVFAANLCSKHYNELRAAEGYQKPLKKNWVCKKTRCQTSAWKQGLCKRHWNLKNGFPEHGKITGRPRVTENRCKHEGCRLEAKVEYYGYCKSHFFKRFKDLHIGLDVGKHVRGVRESMGLLETPFAKLLGIKIEGLRRIESGEGYLLHKYHEIFKEVTGVDHLPKDKMAAWKELISAKP